MTYVPSQCSGMSCYDLCSLSVFQDVHVMIFVGFGFLMTFLRRYGFGAVGLNMLLAAYVLQWATLVHAFFEMEDGKAHINVTTSVTGHQVLCSDVDT